MLKFDTMAKIINLSCTLGGLVFSGVNSIVSNKVAVRQEEKRMEELREFIRQEVKNQTR